MRDRQAAQAGFQTTGFCWIRGSDSFLLRHLGIEAVMLLSLQPAISCRSLVH